jgi:hypothetical protein
MTAAKVRMNAASTRPIRSAKSLPATRSAVAIAPAFTIGLNGRFDLSSSTMALKASPVGSTPTRGSTPSRPWSSRASPNRNGFEIDWMLNDCWASPTSKIWPSAETTLIANHSGSALLSSGM